MVAVVCITRPLRLTWAASSRAPVAPWGSVGKEKGLVVPPGLLLKKEREREREKVVSEMHLHQPQVAKRARVRRTRRHGRGCPRRRRCREHVGTCAGG